jgi:hypothetical protein
MVDLAEKNQEVQMSFLNVALAFALTMLVVSTAVSQVVRLLQTTVKLRRTRLRQMLDQFMANDVQPVIQRELWRLNTVLSKKGEPSQIAEAASAILSNANGEKATPPALALFNEEELADFVEVSTEELIERLKRSDLGKTILTELGDAAEAVFDELGRRYEIVGDSFSESFRKYSRRWAIAIAFVLAALVNIDSVQILDTYIKNERMTRTIVAHVDELVEKQIELAEMTATVPYADSSLEDLSEQYGKLEEQIAFLSSSGFPIGWSYFPYALIADGGLEDVETTDWVMWIVGIILTGILAGLGTPFWYDAITGITRVAQRARLAKGSSQTQARKNCLPKAQ